MNLTLAFNHGRAGTKVEGYHAFNLGTHLVAALVLFGLVRRTAALTWVDSHAPLAIGFAAALLWLVHPLQTEAVTYVVQRAESLCGLFYLLTLYCLVRGATGRRPVAWYVGATLACWLGMATKEVMVTAPVVALLYDRAFLSCSFRQALQNRKWLYVGLAASWLLLAYLVTGTGGRSGSAGFAHAITPAQYALTQAGAILHYLRLSAWPHPLVFDYGFATASGFREAWPQVATVVALLLLLLYAFYTRPRVGFLGVAFFLVLSPSSSFVPIITQTIAEHRMYLPLAAITAGTAAFAYAGLRVLSRIDAPSAPRYALLPTYLVVVGGVAALFAWQTWRRNGDYRSEASIWADTAAKAPTNPRAWVNLARTNFNSGNRAEALELLDRAVEIAPDYADARYNRGIGRQSLGMLDESLEDFDRAIEQDPGVATYYFYRAMARRARGRLSEALEDYDTVVRLQPGFAAAYCNRASIYVALNDAPRALADYGRAIELDPNLVQAYGNRAAVLAQMGDVRGAIEDCSEAIARAPQQRDLYQKRAALFCLAQRNDLAKQDLQAFRELGGVPDPELLRKLAGGE
ncbi:MAG TPA: tetratricopeptide repeat protein [Pirellulales bacterium]|nr:tetratricopeptide repeat protein [Pirellulales bacterium]